MSTHDVTVESTTGTAPITFSTSHTPGRIDITLEDGSSQAYSLADLAAAVEQLIHTTLTTDLLRLQHHGWIDPTSPAVDIVEETAHYLHGAPRVLGDTQLREALLRASADRQARLEQQ